MRCISTFSKTYAVWDSERWIDLASLLPPFSASLNEWVPVFRPKQLQWTRWRSEPSVWALFPHFERDRCRAAEACWSRGGWWLLSAREAFRSHALYSEIALCLVTMKYSDYDRTQDLFPSDYCTPLILTVRDVGQSVQMPITESKRDLCRSASDVTMKQNINNHHEYCNPALIITML